MGCTLDWCKNAEPNLKCVQKTSAKKVKEHQDSIPKVAHTRSRRVTRTINTSVLGALLQEGPSVHPLLMPFHLLLSQMAVTKCQPPGRSHGQGAQIRWIWLCVMSRGIGHQTWTPQRNLTQWLFLLHCPWEKARGQFRTAVSPRRWLLIDRQCNLMENLNHIDYRDKITTHMKKTNSTKDYKLNKMDELTTPKQDKW